MRRHVLIVAIPVIVLMGWADYVSGPDIGFSLFYLAPVSIVAWYAGRWRGVSVAFLAAVCWQVADLGWHTSPGVSLWNGFTRLTIYTATAWLLDRVHTDRGALQRVNHDLEEALQREVALARTDPTTRLPNPRAFLEHLRSDLSRFAQAHCSATLLFLDLDDFKSVNDEYGHGAGDDALMRIAEGLQKQVRGADLAARMGGDEFVVLVWHPDDEDTSALQQNIEAVVAEVAADYPRSLLGVTIGAARIDDATLNAEEIIRTADHAMYAKKVQRKKAARIATPSA